MSERKVPKIRFPGFTDDWEQRQVADIASDTRGGGTPATSNEAYWNGDIPWIQSSDLTLGKVFDVQPRKHISKAGLNGSAAQLIAEHSIAVVTRVGVGKLAYMPYSYATSQDFLSLCRLQTEPCFTVYGLYQMLQRELSTVQGTSIKGMTKEDLLSKVISLPKSMNEQAQIGTYFKNLDNLINLLQCELDKQKELRKGMLQKMFTKEGESEPEIRFPGFETAWNIKKLGDIFSQTNITINPKESGIELWSLTVENGLTKKTERYNREFLVKKEDVFKEVRPGDIVYNPMNMTLGAIGYNSMDNSVAVSGYYTTMIANDGYDSYYINTWLKSPQAIQLYKNYATGSLIEKQRVQFSTLSIIPAAFPTYDEQKKIGMFFKRIDSCIELCECELSKWQTLKKALLQQMFV